MWSATTPTTRPVRRQALALVEEDHLQVLLRETERTVIAHWREVEAVAQALIERKFCLRWKFIGSSSRCADTTLFGLPDSSRRQISFPSGVVVAQYRTAIRNVANELLEREVLNPMQIASIIRRSR